MMRVLLKRALTADYRLQPDRALSFEKVQQHLLVIPSQTDHALGILAAQLHNVVHAARRVGAAIDQVTEKNQRVVCRISRQHVEQVEELSATTMYVTDD